MQFNTLRYSCIDMTTIRLHVPTMLTWLHSKIPFIITCIVILCSWVWFSVVAAVGWTPVILSLCFPQENFHYCSILKQEYLMILANFLYLFFLLSSPHRSDYRWIHWQKCHFFGYTFFFWTGIKEESFVVFASFSFKAAFLGLSNSINQTVLLQMMTIVV